MTVIVINNHGGAIFSLLPVAKTTSPPILQKYFYTSHDISISKLCAAHR
jgi:isochorismate synthase/2-succinyl-5-enolpyruvyl-6-hydroxy-3-cyclohexene-1-carboxylate synthase/2-succinyl-6-hydroxy-2,4-cyclohexadiene-1-carboxylate synthase/O-succinylbenzoate synthase